jgi:hypothetical protein
MPDQAVDYGSLVPGGFYCSTPFDHSIARSIRTNNPGAMNWTTWQTHRRGYVGKTEPDGSANHNVTTIYRTPEHGVASWYHLITAIYGFGADASFELIELARRYAGAHAGSAVDGYLGGWRRGSGGVFTETTSFKTADDASMLSLGKAMFFNEIGRPSPLHDDQILYGITRERAGDLPN